MAAKTPAQPPPRRRRVEGRPGIYVRTDKRGRERFEYCQRDSTGQMRWKTVDGGLLAAVAARDDLRARLRRGERIVSSRITFTELAAQWLNQRHDLRRGSLRWYELALRKHVIPRIGRLSVSTITTDEIANLIQELEQAGYAGSTITNILGPVGQILDNAVRRGLAPSNPLRQLERHERPKIVHAEMRILDRQQISLLLPAASASYRPLLATAIFTGLRAGELLALRWNDIDPAANIIRVRRQSYRTGETAPLKTEKAVRDVLLTPALAQLLQQHRLRSAHQQANDYLFTHTGNRPLHPDTVRTRGLNTAMLKAGLDQPGKPRLRFHDLRHTYASLLIAQGANIAFVSRQLGHSNITTTLNRYTHLFDHAEHSATIIEKLENRYANLLTSSSSREIDATD